MEKNQFLVLIYKRKVKAMKDKLEMKKEILFLTRLISSDYVDKNSKDLIRKKISILIKELLEK